MSADPTISLPAIGNLSPAAVALMDFQLFCRTIVELSEGRVTVEPEDQSEVARVQNFRRLPTQLKK